MDAQKINRGGQRLEWIDSLKGFAILSVVLGHVLLGYGENAAFSEKANIIIGALQEWIYTWHMPLFFTISGYTFYLAYVDKQSRRIKRERLKSQIINLALIYFIFQIALCVLKIVFAAFVDNAMNLSDLIKNIVVPNTLMWYIWVLIIYYLLFMVMVECRIHIGIKFLIASMFVAIFQLTTAKNFTWGLAIGNLFRNFFSFSLGIYLVENEKKANKRWFLIGALIASIVFLISNQLYGEVSVYIGEVNAVFMIVGIFGYFEDHTVNNKMLNALGKQSLVIYLLHTYFVTAMKVVFIRVGLYENWMTIPVILFTWIISVVATYSIALICNRNKYLGLIFHPIKALKK